MGIAIASVGLVSLLGCGQNYRPVVSAINPVGPSSQPTKYAIAVSSPSPTLNGLLTVVDFSGDSILATPEITPFGANPNPELFTLLAGSQAFATNGQTSLSDVPLTSLGTLISTNVVDTTLPTSASTSSNNIPSLSVFELGTATRLLVPQIAQSAVAVLTTASPALQQQISVAANPQYVVGISGTPRAYVLSNPSSTSPGIVSAIEASSLSVSATFPVGLDPVYGVENATAQRAFILNKGSGTVSVINVTNNALDSANPTIPATGTLGQNPVWADLTTATDELVVLNQGDGVHPGSLSIISIPLCSVSALPSNPTCNAANPIDAAGFGDVLATVPVGVNPTMVSVLEDGTQGYVVNSGSGNCEAPTATDVPGSVTVVDLISGTVTATIPAGCDPSLTPGTSSAYVYGHPTTVAATTGTPTGKVYITAPDSRYLSVLETDTDTVDTHINLQGNGVRVLVTAP